MSQENIVLFGPRTGKSLLRTYPELAQDPVFKVLSGDDLLFAWYMGIPNSPVDHDWQDMARYKSAAARCFPNNKDKKENYSVGNVPEEVKAAIERFKTYSPEARFMALKMTQTIFNKFQQMVDVDVKKDFEEIDNEGNVSINFTARKQYVDSAAKIREELPMLIKQIEEGYGVSEKNKGDEQKFGAKAIDKFHKERSSK